MSVTFIGYASGEAAGNPGCGEAPYYLQQHLPILNFAYQWGKIVAPIKGGNKLAAVAELSRQLAIATQEVLTSGSKVVNFGGDHSCAIGFWGGIAEYYRSQGPIGLIWVDAHMDAHTPETSESGNIHGMPLAALLGYGDPALTTIANAKPKLRPEHVALIGIRSYEAGEAELLRSLGVKIYYDHDIAERGLKEIFAEAHAIVNNGTAGYGLSLDLDGLAPDDAPAVGTPVEGGVSILELLPLLEKYMQRDFRFLGAEIVEFNPFLDKSNITLNNIVRILNSLLENALTLNLPSARFEALL